MQQLQHECIVNFLGISEWDNHELLLVSQILLSFNKAANKRLISIQMGFK